MIKTELKRATSLRSLFALWVFLSHCDFLIGGDHPFYTNFAAYGYVGVGFFFILSGFILSYVYRKALMEGAISVRGFILRRIFRLYPLYLITFIIAIPFEGRGESLEWVSRFTANLLMLQSFFPAEHIFFAFNSPSWSVSNEMFFYLLFPLFIFYFRRALIVFAVAMMVMLLIKMSGGGLPFTDDHYFFYINPLFRLSDFVLGMALFLLYERGIRLPRYSTIMGFALMVIFFAFRAVIPEPLLYSIYFYLPISIIILSAADERQTSFMDSILKHRVLVYLGRISYGIYLYHILVLRYVSGILSQYFQGTHPLFTMAICSVVLIAASVVSFEFIESPINRKLRKRYFKT